MQRVYPRACGGTAPAKHLHARNGSIPAPAGEPRPINPTPPARSIPAPAGEPRLCTHGPALVSVYPRACGGTPKDSIQIKAHAGLSPRLRGNRDFQPAVHDKDGLSPRLRGNPRRFSPCTELGLSPGLSPRLRGNPKLQGHTFASPNRVYPRACGGTLGPISPAYWFRERFPSFAPFRVYPRACGGTARWQLSRNPRAGLSPRLRGNRVEGDGYVLVCQGLSPRLRGNLPLAMLRS